MRRLQSLLCTSLIVCGFAIMSASKADAWPTLCPTNQYLAVFYNNLNHSGIPVLARCDKSAGAAWGGHFPGVDVRPGHFSVVYTGSINFPSTGTYNWNANTGDVAVQVTLDGAPVIDHPAASNSDYLVSGTVSQGVHTVQVTVVDAAADGSEEFSVSPAGSGPVSSNGNYFAADSFFNQPIPANSAIDLHTWFWLGLIYANPSVTGIVFNYNAFTVPIYKAPAGAPTASIALTNTNTSITIPYQANYQPSPDTDSHLAVIDTTNGCEYEFQSFNPGSMSALAEATYHVDTGSGGHVSDSGHAGGELSYLGGLITPEDVNAGVINHALRFAIPVNAWTFTYPGTRSDGATFDGVPEGTRIQLDPNLNLNSLNLTPFQLMVAKALQTYGAYDADSGNAFALYAESTTDGSTYSQPFTPLPKSLILNLRFLKPQGPSTTVQLETSNDTTCQQPQ